jgi:hypothetical protein
MMAEVLFPWACNASSTNAKVAPRQACQGGFNDGQDFFLAKL